MSQNFANSPPFAVKSFNCAAVFVILFNLETITLRVVLIGVAAGFIGGSGLPFIYQAFSIGSVSFVSPVVALVQSFNLILFGVFVKFHVPSAKIVSLDPVHIRICCRYHEKGLIL